MKTRQIALIAAIVSAISLMYISHTKGEADIAPATVVSQADISETACGPCALYNAMANGSNELRAAVKRLPGDSPRKRVLEIIERWGKLPSKVYKDNRGRYTPAHGVASIDMTDLTNDALATLSNMRVTGEYVDRQKDEKPEDHLLRVFGALRASLEAGFPPIIEVRSFAARQIGEDFLWFGILGHYVAILEVMPVDADRNKGFVFKYADSYTSRVETGYAHIETRNFAATRAFSVANDGTEEWEWVTDFPYLTVASPTLILNTEKEPWHVRTNLVLRYAICAEVQEKKGN